MDKMQRTYGAKKGAKVFYATMAKRKQKRGLKDRITELHRSGTLKGSR